MSDIRLRDHLKSELDRLKSDGLYKKERLIQTPQGAEITVNGRRVINFCANNYLGLANDPEIVEAAHEGLRKYGYGLSSVRFICGTQDLHRELEGALARFFGKEDSILYSSCFDANGGLFEPLLGENDGLLSDELNHASIIDGVRLCKAKRGRYKHNDMADLESKLVEMKDCRLRMIVTDSVFSMDGDTARLADICDLADRYDAIVAIDDCHGTGHLGKGGRGGRKHSGFSIASISSPRRSAKPWAGRRVGLPSVGAKSSIICATSRGRTCFPMPSYPLWRTLRSRHCG